MPSTHVPPPKSPGPPPLRSPTCSTCGQTLRLITLAPHERFTNLDVRNFVCDGCGETESDMIARSGTGL